MLNEAVAVAAGLGMELSSQETVNVDVPAAVGVPLITPPELMLKPEGSAPPVIAQFTYGGTPPVADNVTEG